MNIVIRKAKESDCKQLSIIKKQVWNDTYRGIYSDEKLDNFEYHKHEEKFKSNIDGLYVILEEEKLIGYFSFSYPRYEYKNYAYSLNSLYLLSCYKRKGIGRKVFEFIDNYCKENLINGFYTNCNKYNENALNFYLKMGGKVTNLVDEGEDKSTHQYFIEFKKS